MRKLGILLVFAFMVTFASSAFAQTAKIAIIDYPKCIRGSEAGKKANEEMKVIESNWAPKIEAIRSEALKLENEYVAQEKALTDTAKKAKIEEIQRKRLEHDNAMRQFQSELEKKDNELMAKIVGEIDKIVEAYAKEKKYNLILNTQAVAHNDGFPDISDEIIARYNKSVAGK